MFADAKLEKGGKRGEKRRKVYREKGGIYTQLLQSAVA
jgi:hypothetical protein